MKQVTQKATYEEESKELVNLWSSIPPELGIVQSTNLYTIRDILSCYQNNTTSIKAKHPKHTHFRLSRRKGLRDKPKGHLRL